jgi:tryptophan synthase alpha chain
VAVGFGVRDAASAAAIAQGAEAVVVGSALVEKVRLSLNAAGKATPATVAAVIALVAELAAGVRNARQQAAE